jgi:Recombinase zinc beta ribbon domain
MAWSRGPFIMRSRTFSGLVSCGACGRLLSTHTILRGSIVYRYCRCRSTAGSRDPCKRVLVSAHEIETAVLEAAGVEQTGLTSKEEEAALRNAIRQVLFKAETGGLKSNFRGGVAEHLASEVLGKV